MALNYTAEPLTEAEVRQRKGPVLLAFGTNWCGHCQAAAPHIAQALAPYPNVQHLQVEDGRGRPLGRAFGVKLWPTLIFLSDGAERARLIRPTETALITDQLKKICI